jgi:hypothetical protein
LPEHSRFTVPWSTSHRKARIKVPLETSPLAFSRLRPAQEAYAASTHIPRRWQKI